MADKKSLPRRLCSGAHTLIRLYGTYIRMDLLWLLRDTRYCLFYMLTDFICAGASVSGVMLLSARLGGFGGMGQEELLFMLSYAVMVDGVYAAFFAGNNFGNISRIIGRGQLDHCVIQPIPYWMQFLAGGCLPFSGSSKLLCGTMLCAYSVRRMGLAVTPGWIVSLLCGLFASAAVMLAYVYILSCLAFLAPVAAEEISSTALSMFDMLKCYPLGSLPPLWQAVFCTAAPVGLAAWLPSRALTIPVSFFPGAAVLAAAVFIALASCIFRRGMYHYMTHGSPRYSGFGRN